MYMLEGLMTDKLSLLFGNGYIIGSGWILHCYCILVLGQSCVCWSLCKAFGTENVFVQFTHRAQQVTKTVSEEELNNYF